MEQENFHNIGAALLEQTVSETYLGLVIIDTVVQNRKDNIVAYKNGSQKDFRNKEENRVLRALGAIAAGEQQPPILTNVLSRQGARLGEYRDIYYINFVYDATKFHYLATRDLERTAHFLGERFLHVFGQPAQQQAETWKRHNYDTKTEEYIKYLTGLRSKLQREFNVVFSK